VPQGHRDDPAEALHTLAEKLHRERCQGAAPNEQPDVEPYRRPGEEPAAELVPDQPRAGCEVGLRSDVERVLLPPPTAFAFVPTTV
jgi:hypothetical protein